MIRHAWTVLCDRVITDRETNNLSMDVVEQFQVTLMEPIPPGVPIAIPTMLTLATLFYGGPEDIGTQVVTRGRIVSPEGNVLGQMGGTFEMTASRVRNLTKIAGLPVSSSGIYEFTLEYQTNGGAWTAAGRVPLELNIAAPAAQPP
jgi:hypothetical protein